MILVEVVLLYTESKGSERDGGDGRLRDAPIPLFGNVLANGQGDGDADGGADETSFDNEGDVVAGVLSHLFFLSWPGTPYTQDSKRSVSMKGFETFYETIFPGDSPVLVNPVTQESSVSELIEEVADVTGVDQDWLEAATGAVVHGLAGAQCLWFLHGAQGEIVEDPDNEGPEWYRFPTDIENWYRETKINAEKEQKLGMVRFEIINTPELWRRGKIGVQKVYAERKDVYQELKLGRVLNAIRAWRQKLYENQGISSFAYQQAQRQYKSRMLDLDQRKMGKGWEWYVSAHPFDVLTMSFDRSWTSCMRPPGKDRDAGEAQFGPLTDMAAGSAVFFIRAKGSMQPCGRVILRPAIGYLDKPTVLFGGKKYGCGPDDFANVDFVEELLEPFLQGVELQEEPLEWFASRGQAMGRNIWDDVGHGEVSQSKENYESAYRALQKANWPEPSLDIGELGTVAQNYVDDYDVCDVGRVPRKAEEVLGDLGIIDWIEGVSFDEAAEMYKRARTDGGIMALDVSYRQRIYDESNIDSEDYSALEDFVSEAGYAIESALAERIMELLYKGKTYMMALPFDPDEQPLGSYKERKWQEADGDVWEGAAAKDPEHISKDLRDADAPVEMDVRAVMAEGDPAMSDEDWSKVEVFIISPEDVHDDTSYVFEDEAVGLVELPPGEYNWQDWLERYDED